MTQKDIGYLSSSFVVISGSGRSGTSLLTEILGEFGFGLSEEMIAGGDLNKRGLFEDKNIVETHIEMFRKLSSSPWLPLPEDWQTKAATNVARQQLTEIVYRETKLAGEKTWVIKDPRISLIVPLWRKIANELHLIPNFIFATRDPRSIIESQNMVRGSENQSASELMWLERTTQMLSALKADCYILHYEDWFEDANSTLVSVLEFLGQQLSEPETTAKKLSNIVQPTLNRSQYNDVVIENYWINKLSEELNNCSGYYFSRKKLLKIVEDYRNSTKSFIGWTRQATSLLVASENNRDKRYGGLENKLDAKVAQIEKLEVSLEHERTQKQELHRKFQNLKIAHTNLKEKQASFIDKGLGVDLQTAVSKLERKLTQDEKWRQRHDTEIHAFNNLTIKHEAQKAETIQWKKKYKDVRSENKKLKNRSAFEIIFSRNKETKISD